MRPAIGADRREEGPISNLNREFGHERAASRRRYAAWATPASGSPSLYTCLLDADDDLAQEFDVHALLAARRQANVRVLELEVGDCDLAPWLERIENGLGLLIFDGLIGLDARVDSRTATELVGPGDLLQPNVGQSDALLERSDTWRALCPTRLALLDGDFVERTLPWPQILRTLLRRAGRRIGDVDVLRAIMCQPRLEVRLALLFWHLAGRWGRVEPGGIRLSLPLTHRLLGQVVGAERPSISHALSRLAQGGLVTGAAGDWHLHGSIEEHLEYLVERISALREPPAQRKAAQ